jgi:hypothetical protein
MRRLFALIFRSCNRLELAPCLRGVGWLPKHHWASPSASLDKSMQLRIAYQRRGQLSRQTLIDVAVNSKWGKPENLIPVKGLICFVGITKERNTLIFDEI